MDTSEKIARLQQQIDEANDGTPVDFNLWRQTSGVVLRGVLGDANPLCENFERINYGLSMWSTSTPQSAWQRAQASGVRQGVAILRAAMTEVEISGGTPEPARTGPASVGTSIFIVHGHDEARKHEVARLLQGLTKNEPTILHEQANGGLTILEKFESHASQAAYAVVIATGDDLGRARGAQDEQPRARQNVVLELGFFFGALGRARVALLYEDGVERPSDIDGIVRIPLDRAGGWKAQLARELSGVGIGVDWSALGR